jgi:hypothetical protein
VKNVEVIIMGKETLNTTNSKRKKDQNCRLLKKLCKDLIRKKRLFNSRILMKRQTRLYQN